MNTYVLASVKSYICTGGMGGRQSKQLKKELAELKCQAAVAKRKHEEELEGVKRDKRELEYKLSALQELTAQAELAAEKANQLVVESEERVKALKWELVRKLTVPIASPSSRAPTSIATSLAAAESSSPRAALNWKLRDGVMLHRSSTASLPNSGTTDAAKTTRRDKQRPHAQSEPVMPQKQLQRSQDPNTLRNGNNTSDARAKAKGVSSSNNDDEIKVLPVSHPPSSSPPPSSEDKKPPAKYPALSRKQSAQMPASQTHGKSKSATSDESEPESELLSRRTRSGELEQKSRETDRESKRQKSEQDDSDREISEHTSRTSRVEEAVLAFSSVEDDSS